MKLLLFRSNKQDFEEIVLIIKKDHRFEQKKRVGEGKKK